MSATFTAPAALPVLLQRFLDNFLSTLPTRAGTADKKPEATAEDDATAVLTAAQAAVVRDLLPQWLRIVHAAATTGSHGENAPASGSEATEHNCLKRTERNKQQLDADRCRDSGNGLTRMARVVDASYFRAAPLALVMSATVEGNHHPPQQLRQRLPGQQCGEESLGLLRSALCEYLHMTDKERKPTADADPAVDDGGANVAPATAVVATAVETAFDPLAASASRSWLSCCWLQLLGVYADHHPIHPSLLQPLHADAARSHHSIAAAQGVIAVNDAMHAALTASPVDAFTQEAFMAHVAGTCGVAPLPSEGSEDQTHDVEKGNTLKDTTQQETDLMGSRLPLEQTALLFYWTCTLVACDGNAQQFPPERLPWRLFTRICAALAARTRACVTNESIALATAPDAMAEHDPRVGVKAQPLVGVLSATALRCPIARGPHTTNRHHHAASLWPQSQKQRRGSGPDDRRRASDVVEARSSLDDSADGDEEEVDIEDAEDDSDEGGPSSVSSGGRERAHVRRRIGAESETPLAFPLLGWGPWRGGAAVGRGGEAGARTGLLCWYPHTSSSAHQRQIMRMEEG